MCVLRPQILSWYPRIVVYPSFVDEARRKEIIAQVREGVEGSSWLADAAWPCGDCTYVPGQGYRGHPSG